MPNDPWVFNYRSHCYDYSDSDADSDSDYSFRGSKPNISDESRFRSELDISTRPDAAVFKPNPFSIAKVNAFTRSSRPIVSAPTQVAQKSKDTSTVHAFVGKTVRKKPTAPKAPSSPGGCNSMASSQSLSTTRRNMEQQPSNPTNSCINQSLNSSRLKLNIVQSSSNRPRQVYANYARDDRDTQRVSSSKNIPHIPVPAYIEGEPLSPAYTKTALLQSQELRSRRQVVVHDVRTGKANRSLVPLEDPYPLASPRDKRESRLPIISSTNRKERSNEKSNHTSGVNSVISPATITHTRYVSTKGLVNSSKVDSTAHTSSTAGKELKCYEGKPDEDESWSTLPPRKKFKPSVQPASKYKMTGPFRIPGLNHDGDGVKTGMSATSSNRVVTFLPTPPISNFHKGRGNAELESLSSPPSSPQSHNYFDFTDKSSPPTSDSPEADYGLNVRWDTYQLEERYAQIPKAIEEV